MKMKQLLCMLVLTISGNAFGEMITRPGEDGTGTAPQYQPGYVTQPPMPQMRTGYPVSAQGSTAITNVTDMATNHFASLMQDMPNNHPIITEAQTMGKNLKWHDVLTQEVIMLIKQAHNQGVIDALTTTGQHMQSALTAMGNIVTMEQKSILMMSQPAKK